LSFRLVALAGLLRLGRERLIGEVARRVYPDIAVRTGDDIVPRTLEPAGKILMTLSPLRACL
jgi:hypothetical protein